MLARASPLRRWSNQECVLSSAHRVRHASAFTAIHRALRQDGQTRPRREENFRQSRQSYEDLERESRTPRFRKNNSDHDSQSWNRNRSATPRNHRETTPDNASIPRKHRSEYHQQRPRPYDPVGYTDRTKFPSRRDVIQTGYEPAPKENGHRQIATPHWVRIPYTTAASQFLYGYSSVLAALKSGRRKIYKLYFRSGTEDRDADFAELNKWAHVRGAKVVKCGREYEPMMDKLTGGRPHNGILLEVSPLPVLPITHLGPVSLKDEHFDVGIASQTKEEQEINGIESRYTYRSRSWRYPLILYLDGITDEGNFGAILRSAYLLGVDGIIMNARRCAPLSAITGKASSGALEAVRLFKVENPEPLIQHSSAAGWNCYAADMIQEHTLYDGDPGVSFAPKRGPDSPLKDAPSLLILGNEETGVSKHIIKLAKNRVAITAGTPPGDIGLDSFNVSVASALLCMNFMQDRSKEEENRLF